MKNRRVVWFLNHYAQTPGGVGGTRHYWLSHYMNEYDWTSCVMASSDEVNTGRQRLQAGVDRKLEKIDNVTFLWIRTTSYAGSGLRRIINMLSYFVQILRPSMTEGLPKPDVVVGSSVHPLAALAGQRWAKRYGVPFIFEVRDLWPETLIQFGKIKRESVLAKSLRYLEGYLYRSASRIVTLLPEAWKYIADFNVAREKIIWIPNGSNVSSFPCEPMKEEENSFKLMYFGAHGQANCLDVLLQAMKILETQEKEKTIELHLIGEGPMKSSLKATANEMSLKGVYFHEGVASSSIPHIACKADAFVMTALNRPDLYRYGISMNKLFDYLAAARPIIVALSAANNPVEEANAGISIQPEDPEAMAKAILDLANTPLEKRKIYGLNGRRYIEEKHDYRVLAGKYCAMLDEIS